MSSYLSDANYKGILQEKMQHKRLHMPTYITYSVDSSFISKVTLSSNPDYNIFEPVFYFGDTKSTSKESQKSAAYNALNNINPNVDVYNKPILPSSPSDYKSVLQIKFQKSGKRLPEYTTYEVNDAFIAKVQLVDNQDFRIITPVFYYGEVKGNSKEAQKSAAYHALNNINPNVEYFKDYELDNFSDDTVIIIDIENKPINAFPSRIVNHIVSKYNVYGVYSESANNSTIETLKSKITLLKTASRSRDSADSLIILLIAKLILRGGLNKFVIVSLDHVFGTIKEGLKTLGIYNIEIRVYKSATDLGMAMGVL